MGIGFLPKSVVEASNFASKLWPLLPDAEAPICTLFFMANASSVRSAPAQLLFDTALAYLQRDSDGRSDHRPRPESRRSASAPVPLRRQQTVRVR
jgi:hypothetical protein